MKASLYTQAMIECAAQVKIPHRLSNPQASITLDNPLCGDRVTIDLCMHGNVVSSIGHEIKACLLCEAALATIVNNFPGKTREEIKTAIDEISRLMKEGIPPSKLWVSLALFTPVQESRSRHSCVLLPFHAVAKAMNQI